MPFPLLPGRGGDGAADKLTALSALPATAGYEVGDVIDVGGVLWRLVAATHPRNEHDGVTQQRAGSLIGDDVFEWEGSPPNVHLEVPVSVVGANPPQTLYVQWHLGWRYSQTELTRATVTGGTREYLRAAGGDGIASESEWVGDKFSITVWTDQAFSQPFDFQAAAERWVLVDAPRDTAAQDGGGAGGQQSPGAGDGFSRGAAAPASPAEGDVWSDTTTDKVRRYDGAAWQNLATEGYADTGDALSSAAIDDTVRSLFRRAQWVRAWIRAADATAALAGISAATWTNRGAGTPPTGASWDVGAVASSAVPLWELTALVSPTPGDPDGWTFGAWAAVHITAVNTQYSVDGATGWHAAPRVGGDRYERHFTGGAWGPAIPLYAAEELAWATLLSADVYQESRNVLTTGAQILLDLPSTIEFTRLNLMRISLETRVSGVRVIGGSVIVDPLLFFSVSYADRADATPGSHEQWQVRIGGYGLGVIGGGVSFGSNAAYGAGSDTGMTLVWVRPNAASHAREAAHLRAVYVRSRGVTYRLKIEAI